MILSGQARDRIFVQFAEGSGIRLRGGRLVSLTGVDLQELYSVLNQFQAQIERLYPQSEQRLEQQRRELEAASCRELPDRNLAYSLSVSPGQDTGRLIDLLNALAIVELAEPVPIVLNP